MAKVMPADGASRTGRSILSAPSGGSAGVGALRKRHGLTRKVRVLIR